MSLPISRRVRQQLSLDPRRFGASGKVSLTSFASAYALAEALREREGVSQGQGNALTGENLAALDLLEDLAQAAVEELTADIDPDFLDRCMKSFDTQLGEAQSAARWERLAEMLQIHTPAATAHASPQEKQGICMKQLLGAALVRKHPLAARILGQLGLDETEEPELGQTLEVIDELLGEERSMLSGGLELPLETLADIDPSSFDDLLATLAGWPGPWDETDRQRIDAVLALLAEAQTARHPPGQAPTAGIGLDEGPAAYSDDAVWMRQLVLVAKNVLVWLDQLSRRYQRPIARLDEIPDEELESLASRGFTGLWLIGVWERSPASRRLKLDQGTEDAAPSAYAVRRYRIAADLGGDEALQDLSVRARRAGLRLAADFVPNHMAIDSDWVISEPERFVRRADSPFPSYRFEGPDLSPDPRISLQIEDRYRDQSDAAVVFRRLDRASGEEQFIYHGNDGTSIPWNDTAQLDYLSAETRAAVLEEIVAAAKLFPILRFDAAMTITRHHFHRLWYPDSEVAGAIPSRAEHGMSPEEFRSRVPEEFWRQVVDRVAEEAPDTLLLAEAFWLMEGYFVRRLGLHRVYNSAFMHMLRDGETRKLQRILQEAVDIDPELLGRFTNYLSTPDEETAAVQFGRAERYFGACRVLATLPGLPLFTHGQWEGLEEKYGMEFRGPRWDETPDERIVERHEREITPLLLQRERFASVDEFQLLDLIDEEGIPEETVLAFSNGSAADLAIVAFNNSEVPVSGWLDQLTLPHDATELRDLAGERRVSIAATDRDAGRVRLELAPFECVVLVLR